MEFSLVLEVLNQSWKFMDKSGERKREREGVIEFCSSTNTIKKDLEGGGRGLIEKP
jgi:hypothetical protein